MKKVLWLDVDGVLLDYTRAFLKFAGLGTTYEDLTGYDLTTLFETKEQCWDTMKAFACSKEFADLPVHTPAFYLHALKNAGYDLRIITQLTAPAHARKNRIANLTNVYGGIFSEIVFTNIGECKLDYLWDRWCREGDFGDMGADSYILIEDNPKLLLKADDRENYGYVEVMAIEHPYNNKEIADISLNKYASFGGVYHNLIDRVV
jgi:hypothetical protein